MCLAAKGWFQGWADKLMLCAMGYLGKTHLKKSILIKYIVSLACVQRFACMISSGLKVTSLSVWHCLLLNA
jgi:hypothetical protein